ncbi:MAG: hypothetical protein M3Z10_07245, partial [Gemmatimonadota bacterium]|nr:hypothetical protein [Gemmatimonadota bacterium]
MMMLRRIVLTALVAAPAVLHAQDRQTQRDAFTLSERVPAGQWIRVRNMNGDVRVRASTSDKVEVVGTKTWRRGDPKDVQIETKKSSDGSILVCAIWSENTRCTEDGYSTHNDGWRRGDRNNDVAVDFEVRVP